MTHNLYQARRLDPQQILAAQEIFRRVESWNQQEPAFERLRTAFPSESDWGGTLVKVAALNAMYSTGLLAINTMATHIVNLLSDKRVDRSKPEFVDRIAVLKFGSGSGSKIRAFTSFASKYAHFFISSNFPIFDSFALRTVEWHLGPSRIKIAPQKRYSCFHTRVFELIRTNDLRCTVIELDRYLWLAGEFDEWERNRDSNRIAKDIKQVFKARRVWIKKEVQRALQRR